MLSSKDYQLWRHSVRGVLGRRGEEEEEEEEWEEKVLNCVLSH